METLNGLFIVHIQHSLLYKIITIMTNREIFFLVYSPMLFCASHVVNVRL